MGEPWEPRWAVIVGYVAAWTLIVSLLLIVGAGLILVVQTVSQ
jgi:hypothetical protein